MYCKDCGMELPNDSNFCSKCGKANVAENKDNYALDTSSSKSDIILEGGCTFFYYEPGETSKDGADCKFQLTSNSIKFVPNGIFSFGAFGKNDSMELPLNRIISVKKTKYNLLFPAIEILTDDKSVFKFAGFGKINDAYSKICEMCDLK